MPVINIPLWLGMLLALVQGVVAQAVNNQDQPESAESCFTIGGLDAYSVRDQVLFLLVGP